MAAQRPIRPVIDKKLMGREVIACLNYGEGATYEEPVWSIMGGPTNCRF